MTLFTAAGTLPFGVAACIMIGLAIVECLGLLAAVSPSQFLDNLVSHAPDSLEGALGWLHVGKVPMLILLIFFLLGFSVSGYGIQIVVHNATAVYLPSWLAAIPAGLTGIGAVRVLGGLLARIIPKDETTAVPSASLIGRAGVIVTGTARAGVAAEVRIHDQHGNTHYLMVEPDLPEESFGQGTEVLIVKKAGAFYRGIRNPHPSLMPHS